MRTAENKIMTTKIAKRAMVARESIGLPPCGRWGSSGRFNDENEALAVNDFDASPRLQRQASARTPDLPVDAHSSLFSVPRHRLALGAEQPLLAGDDGTPPRPQQHREHQQEERGGRNRGRADHRKREGEAWRTGGKHHDRADHERDDPADTNDAEGADMSLGHHQTDTEQHQRRDRKSTRLNSSHLGISYAVF